MDRIMRRCCGKSWNVFSPDRTPAASTGEAMLRGGALRIWRKALLAGHPAAIDSTIATLRQDDGLEPCRSIAWMPTAALAASPRPFVRLLGLTSSGWPRRIAEDRLLPGHVVPSAELEPLTVTMADRRDFDTILATTEREVALSRARRDADGRLLGRSPLIRGRAEAYLRRNRTPAHAMSETDRSSPGRTNSRPVPLHAPLYCWTTGCRAR
jgi:hypothetical protein